MSRQDRRSDIQVIGILLYWGIFWLWGLATYESSGEAHDQSFYSFYSFFFSLFSGVLRKQWSDRRKVDRVDFKHQIIMMQSYLLPIRIE